MTSVHPSMTDVAKSRGTSLKISARLDLSITFILLLSAISLTCCFSRPPGFQSPWGNRIVAEKGKGRKATHNCLFLKHVWSLEQEYCARDEVVNKLFALVYNSVIQLRWHRSFSCSHASPGLRRCDCPSEGDVRTSWGLSLRISCVGRYGGC